MNTNRSKYKSVSCIILAYNEEKTLAPVVEEAILELKSHGYSEIEILIVDDGSTDSTGSISEELSEKFREVRVIHHPQNRGPGSGVKTGVMNAKGEVIFYHPADGQVDLKGVLSHIPLLDEYDLLVGERTSRPEYTFIRKFVSKGSILLMKILFGTKFNDYYFIYLYRKSIFEGMNLESDGVFVVAEILVKAIANGAKARPVIVDCFPRKFGKASCGKPTVVFKTLYEFLRFWFKFKILRIR